MMRNRKRNQLPLLLFFFLLLVLLGLVGNLMFRRLPPHPSTTKKKNGAMILVFYHIPRTGGTTLRDALQPLVSSYVRVAKPSDWDRVESRMSQVFQGSASKDETLLVELHGTIPGLPVLHETMQQWRQQSVIHQVPLFAFTMIRDPVSFSQSYFHHFHATNCTWNWCERETYSQDTDEHLLQTVVPNHQCQLLLYGQRENKKKKTKKPSSPTTEQCQSELIPWLEQDWDWIGTTDTLDTVTLPLLLQLLSHPKNDESIRIPKKKNASSKQQQLHANTMQHIRQQSSFDQALYERVRSQPWQRTKTAGVA